MSMFVAAHGALYPKESAPAIWFAGVRSGFNINEGDSTTLSIRVVNWIPGQSRCIWWMTGASAGASRWLSSWPAAIKQAVETAGLKFTLLGPATIPNSVGTVDVMIEVPFNTTYKGQEIMVTNTTRKNHKNDTDPTTGQLVLLSKVSSRISGAGNDPDTLKVYGLTNVVSINDTSKRPDGDPTFKITAFDLDGINAPKTALGVGDGAVLKFETTNILPGTKVKVYAANAGQLSFGEVGFRGYMLQGIQAGLPRGMTYEATPYPPPPGQSWYRGYTLVYGEDYSDTSSFSFPFQIGSTPEDGSGIQLDIVCEISREGTASDFDSYQPRGDYDSNSTYIKGDWVTYNADGLKYIALTGVGKNINPSNETYWRQYVPVQVIRGSLSFLLKENPPRYWEIRAKKDSGDLHYTVNCPALSPGSSVNLTSINEPSGFQAALTAAAAANGSAISYSNGVLTSTSSSSKTNHSISFTVPTSGVGKHRLILGGVTGSYIGISESVVFLTTPTLPVDPSYITGVNCSSAEFGDNNPGTYGNDYEYPSFPERTDPITRHQEFDYLWNLGIRVVRIPFLWGRIQRAPYADLYGEKDPAAPWNQSYDIARMDELINYWTVIKGGRLILDCHNYLNGPTPGAGKIRFDPDQDASGASFPIEVLSDLWVKLAARYENNPKVWLGLMNEPKGTASGPWYCRMVFQTVVNAIRSRTNSLSKIFVPGTEFSSCQNWLSNGQADAYADFYDPANNYVYEPHNYFDVDASGTMGTCIANSQNRLIAITTMARSRNPPVRLWMGEIAGGDPTVAGQGVCGTVTPAAYNYMKANKDVWLGWSCWGYGKRWPPTYVFNMNPVDYLTPSAPMPTMQMFMPFIAEEY